MAGPMIPPEILNRKSLFSLLHKLDFEIAEQTRVRRCPIAGDRCTTPTMHESLGAVLLIWMRHLKFAIACAAVVKAADAVSFRHRFGSGGAGYTGHRCYLSPPPVDRDEIRIGLWSNSKAFSVYGAPPLIVGNTIFEGSLPRALPTGVWPGT